MPSPRNSWLALDAAGVRIRYRASQESAAGSAAQAVRATVAQLTDELGIAPERRMVLILHPTHREFAGAIGIRRREMVVGIATGAQDVAHVDASGSVADVSSVVAHEMAHLLLAQAVGQGVPRWFDEGYAERASGSPEWAARGRLAEGMDTGRLFALAELEKAFPRDGEAAAMAYAQSHALVAYIVRHAPAGALPDLVRRVRAGESFEAALVAATGRDSGAWDTEWRHDLRGRPQWYPWVAFAAGASGLVMALLCVLAYRAIRQRKGRLPD